MGKDVIVTWGADHLTGHDAATGKLLWECGGFNPDATANWRTIASARGQRRRRDRAVWAWRVSYWRSRGRQRRYHQVGRIWEKNGHGKSADVPTPVVVDGKAYLLNDTGRITCVNLKTGDELWSADLPKNRHKFYSSPVLAGDKLYCVREDGISVRWPGERRRV